MIKMRDEGYDIAPTIRCSEGIVHGVSSCERLEELADDASQTLPSWRSSAGNGSAKINQPNNAAVLR